MVRRTVRLRAHCVRPLGPPLRLHECVWIKNGPTHKQHTNVTHRSVVHLAA